MVEVRPIAYGVVVQQCRLWIVLFEACLVCMLGHSRSGEGVDIPIPSVKSLISTTVFGLM